MNEMVERIARALHDDNATINPMAPFERQPAGWQDKWRREARAALAAMREPTLAMVQAGYREHKHGNGIAGIWHAMIDEALRDATLA